MPDDASSPILSILEKFAINEMPLDIAVFLTTPGTWQNCWFVKPRASEPAMHEETEQSEGNKAAEEANDVNDVRPLLFFSRGAGREMHVTSNGLGADHESESAREELYERLESDGALKFR